MKSLRLYSILLLFLCLSTFSFAQETAAFTEKYKHLKTGLSLVDQKLYAPAQLEFDKLRDEVKQAADNEAYTILLFADFYDALCAARLNDADAELQLIRFIENYHHTTLRNKAYFELGSYYFRNNNSTEALKWYEKVNTKELTNDELIEYRFHKAYAYFKKKKFNEAKPLFKQIKNTQHTYSEPSTYYYGFITFYEEKYNEAEKNFLSLQDSKIYKDAVPYYLTQIYFLRGEYQKVIDYAGPLLSNKKMDNLAEIAHIVGQAYFELGDYENAAPLIEAYIDDAKKVSKEEMYQLAYAQYKMGDYKEAVNNFQELYLLEDSLGQNALYCLADCYLKTKDKAKARDAFSQAASFDFDPFIQEVALFQYAKLSLELSYTSQAISALTTFLEDYPQSVYANEAGELLSQALLETKDYAKAIELLESYDVSGPAVNKVYQLVTYYRAIELYNDKRFPEALKHVNKSLQKPIDNDINGLAYFLKGNILYELEDYASASSNFTQYKQFTIKDAQNEEFASKSLANYNIAYCQFKQKDYATAAGYFEQTIKDKGQLKSYHQHIIPDAFLRNADCLFMVKSYTKAIQHYDEVINKNWKNAEYALVQKSVINGLQGNYSDKISTLRYLHTKYPNSIYEDYAYFEIGNAHLSTENYTSAISSFKTLSNDFTQSPYTPKALLKLGLAYFNTGQEEKALNAYKSVVIQYGNTEESIEALRALKELYLYLGRPNEYVAFVQNHAGIDVSTGQQDSLVFESAEAQFQAGNCNKAITSLSEYLSMFPNGIFKTQAHYYRGECFFKGPNYEAALSDFDNVISASPNKYAENALVKATFISYEINRNYEKSLSYYEQLNQLASTSTNQDIALIGLMRCHFNLLNYKQVNDLATQVLNKNNLTDELRNEATFYKAKAYLEEGKYDMAKPYFETLVDQLSISAIKAEAAYSLAYILHKKYLYEASNEACFTIKNEYASYEYWVVKTFILIADNYTMLGNTFQAKATLQSIVDNYKGDQALIDEATEKLEQLKQEEINNSKIDLQPNQNDTIEFDNQ